MSTKLCEAILDKGIRHTHFFNGRLLTAEDLETEKLAQGRSLDQLGRAIGGGIVSGLEVSIGSDGAGGKDAILSVEKGLALTASGQSLELPDKIDLLVAGLPKRGSPTNGGFAPCDLTVQGLVKGTGIYILLLSPASDFGDQYAPMTGLGSGGKITGCGRRHVIDGVQFRLVKLDPDLAPGISGQTIQEIKALIEGTNVAGTVPGQSAKLSLLRNRLAHCCFGTEILAPLEADPFAGIPDAKLGAAYPHYGSMAAFLALWAVTSAGQPPPAAADVPLALVCWAGGRLRFVDMWSVRRHAKGSFDKDHWGVFPAQRRWREGEAIFLQFQEHVQWLLETDNKPEAVTAREYFHYLPAAGILPLGSKGTPAGFSPGAFFADTTVRDPTFLKGAALSALLRESFAYPPIATTSPELVYVYRVDENARACDTLGGAGPVSYRIFCHGSVPFRGEARFDVSHWNYSTYV